MCRFIETLCYDKGAYALLAFHQERINRTFFDHFPNLPVLSLASVLPFPAGGGTIKTRVVYGETCLDVSFENYERKRIQKLQLVYDDAIGYAFKYENRKRLEQLYAQRGAADEILIIKQGRVTDAFFANVALWDGDCWHTPIHCLLPGVKRAYYLSTGLLTLSDIAVTDLRSFSKISLINALNDLGDLEVPVSSLQF